MLNTQVDSAYQQEADTIILRRTLYAAGAGLIPVPIVDVAAILGVQVLMIRDIARVYEVEFREQKVKPLITSLAGDIAAFGLFKFIPGLGTFFGGVSAAAAGAAATYAVGKVFSRHFAQGGTLLDFDPIRYKEFFQKEFEKGKEVVANLKNKTAGGHKNEQAATDTHVILEQNKTLHAEILALQQQVEVLRRKKTADLTNLQIIEGIGHKVEAALKAGGITDLKQLATSTPEAIQAILDNAKGDFDLVVPDSWPQQAALAAKGDMVALKALQDSLSGGKKITSV